MMLTRNHKTNERYGSVKALISSTSGEVVGIGAHTRVDAEDIPQPLSARRVTGLPHCHYIIIIIIIIIIIGIVVILYNINCSLLITLNVRLYHIHVQSLVKKYWQKYSKRKIVQKVIAKKLNLFVTLTEQRPKAETNDDLWYNVQSTTTSIELWAQRVDDVDEITQWVESKYNSTHNRLLRRRVSLSRHRLQRYCQQQLVLYCKQL